MNASKGFPRLPSAIAVLALASLLAARASADDVSLPEPGGDASDPAVHLVLVGNDEFLHGDLANAARDYRAALRRAPGSPIATFNLGLVELHDGHKPAGVADLNRGIALAVKSGMPAKVLARLRALRAAFSTSRVETT